MSSVEVTQDASQLSEAEIAAIIAERAKVGIVCRVVVAGATKTLVCVLPPLKKQD